MIFLYIGLTRVIRMRGVIWITIIFIFSMSCNHELPFSCATILDYINNCSQKVARFSSFFCLKLALEQEESLKPHVSINVLY